MSTETSTAAYAKLPDVQTLAEEATGYPLRRYIEAIFDPMDELAQLIREPWTDPAECPPQFLEWLESLVRAPTPGATETQRRATLTNPDRLARGTAKAIRAQLRAAYPTLTDNDITITPHWRGNEWIVAVTTPIEKLPRTGTGITTWADLEETVPTWQDLLNACANWQWWTIDKIHLDATRAIAPDRPIGCWLIHVPYSASALPPPSPSSDPSAFGAFFTLPGFGTATAT